MTAYLFADDADQHDMERRAAGAEMLGPEDAACAKLLAPPVQPACNNGRS
jgi:hypothetical protein